MSEPGTAAAALRDFLVPDLGEGLESATIVEWTVAVGDAVELNQTLCTVETAKAEVDVPSPFAGTIVELGGDEGETLVVGTLLARIALGASAPEAPPDRRAGVSGGSGAPSTHASDQQASSARQPTLVGYGLDESMDRSRRRPGPGPGPAPGPRPAPRDLVEVVTDRPRQRARAKPPVRKLARALGVDLATLAPGSGQGGIVTRADVERAAGSPDVPPVGAPAGAADGYSVVPVRGVRATIAQRMAQSVATIPSATCGVTVDATELLAARVALNARLERRGSEPVVTPFSLLCHLLVRALAADPTFNSTYLAPAPDGGPPEIHVFDEVHLGVATATPRGLLVPVVRGAQALGLVALSTEMARVAAAGREGRLVPGELQGSTITVSNFGALGLDDGIPIINPPEAAIVGVGAIRKRPHVVGDEVVARSTAHLTLSFDHRVGDGAEGGRLLAALRELIEEPILALATT